MSQRDQQFLQLYHTYRHEEQIDYYEKREKEFEEAQNEFVNISTVLMIVAAMMSILSSIDSSDFKIWWAVLAVVFPTLSAALSTYNNLYAFERQAKIYQDAVHRLWKSRRKFRVIQRLKQESEYHQAMVDYVNEVEKVFLEERGQWGLLVDDIKPIEPPLPES